MNQTSTIGWEQANQNCLTAALSEVRSLLAGYLTRNEQPVRGEEIVSVSDTVTFSSSPAMDAPSALDILCVNFGLSTFERRILLLCAGVELDSRFGNLIRQASATQSPLPSFALALAAFGDAHWSALLPARPLRHWHLLEMPPGDTLTSTPLRIDERILHYLAGTFSIDERLRPITEAASVAGELAPSLRALAQKAAGAWTRASGESLSAIVQLCGGEPGIRRAIAAATCAIYGLNLRVMAATATPRTATELDLFLRLWEREAALSPLALMLECDDSESADPAVEAAVRRLLETLRSPLLLSVRERRKPLERVVLSFDVPRLTADEQQQLWSEALAVQSANLNGSVQKLVSQFSMNAGSIRAAVAQAILPDTATPNTTGANDESPEKRLAGELWDACRVQARPRLEGLAQRIEAVAGWEDLVLPPAQKQLLAQIAVHVRHRSQVYQAWGFASKSSRGLGINALFAGPSGTGKTMAGEVLANQLRLDLYRIDLSQVVSKYIGETEKNLRRVFDAAEAGSAILLFDEADALFGKRSEVKDSHDRYANIEVSYLLQRMEAFSGLAILTTNRRESLDSAFLRRIRFVVDFPFPEAAQRAEIWRRAFPCKTPTEGLRVDKLARLSAAGGNIQNIAMGAAFLAADSGEPVRMSHLLSAARNEFAKLERPLAEAETAGWV